MSPFGRPLASSTASETARVYGRSRPDLPMKDWLPPSSLSAVRVARISEALSERDREVLRIVGRLRVLTGAQLARLFWDQGRPDSRARIARRGLARLADLEVLERLPRRIGGVRAGSSGLVFAAGRVGQRLLATDQRTDRRVRRAHAPGERYLAHALGISDLYVRLVEAQRWKLAELLDFDPEPACWRPYLGPYGAHLIAKPDAYVRVGIGDSELSWFVEVDLATEAPVTVAKKARGYVDLFRAGEEQRARGVFPRVAWIAPDAARVAVIREALAALRRPELFAVTTASEAITLLSTEDAS